MRSCSICDFAFCFCRRMCSANSLMAPFPPTLWQVYLAALMATVGASPGTALRPARFRTLTSGSSAPSRRKKGKGVIWDQSEHLCRNGLKCSLWSICSEIVGRTLEPIFKAAYTERMLSLADKNLSDRTHILLEEEQLVPSNRRYRAAKVRLTGGGTLVYLRLLKCEHVIVYQHLFITRAPLCCQWDGGTWQSTGAFGASSTAVYVVTCSVIGRIYTQTVSEGNMNVTIFLSKLTNKSLQRLKCFFFPCIYLILIS